MNAVMSYNNSKKREREEDKQKAVKQRKTVEDAIAFLEMGKEPSEYTVAQLKVLNKYTRHDQETHP